MAEHRAPREQRKRPRHAAHGYQECWDEDHGVTVRQRMHRILYVIVAIGTVMVLGGLAAWRLHI
jgi:hypothetical protein